MNIHFLVGWWFCVDAVVQLKAVLFGTDPWVISCYGKDEIVSTELQKASTSLFNQAGVQTAVVDCKAKLPSGKTVYERVGLSAKKKYLQVPFLYFSYSSPVTASTICTNVYASAYVKLS